MAYSAVLSLTQILQQIKAPAGHCILYKKQQIESLEEKVSFLLDFLENNSAYTSEAVKNLEMKIRDMAHRAEDIIESYIYNSIVDGRIMRRLRYLICKGMDTLIKETHIIHQEALRIHKRILEQIYAQQRTHLPHVNRPTLTFCDKTPPMVGLVDDTMKIKEWLTSSSSKREVISIVGMGGIGKTTFARSLFYDSLIVYHFQVRAWVTVSQEYHMHDILIGLLDSTIQQSPEMRKESCEELAERLYKSLKGKAYLIVMDDMWDTKVWDELKRVFPDDNNGSRIVLTTRQTNVGVHVASFDHLHTMSFLGPNESWNLFCETVFGGECCPPHLERIGREVTRKCIGLPLSIVVISGLLLMDKTVSYWKAISISLNSILSADGSQCSSVFSLSYNHLPVHLKSCFLYFAIFPEDYDIERSKIVKLWVAEGFIKPNESKTLEDTAEEYLEDLLKRNLIMVSKLGSTGRVRTYRIHDLLRDFSTTEAQKEKFFLVTTRTRFTTIHPEVIRSQRRVSFHKCWLEDDIHFFNSTKPALIRSLVRFDSADHCKFMSKLFCFRLLRVVVVTGVLSEFPIEVVRLVYLRYLSLNFWKDINIPASISSIWGLQTLIINISGTRKFSPEWTLAVWKMPHLRHVCIGGACYLRCPPSSRFEGGNFGILDKLETLWWVRNFRFTDEVVKRIPNVKKLKVFYDEEAEWPPHFHLSNIVLLNKLRTLNITHSFFTRILGRISLLNNIRFPKSLKKLTLHHCSLPWKDLTIAGSLPNLEVLKLKALSCQGEVWEPNEGEFPELKFLKLDSLDLVHWRADYYHFPKLKCLEIRDCYQLKEIPIGIGNITTLEMILLDFAIPSAVASAKLILDEQRSFGNEVLQVGIVGIYMNRSSLG